MGIQMSCAAYFYKNSMLFKRNVCTYICNSTKTRHPEATKGYYGLSYRYSIRTCYIYAEYPIICCQITSFGGVFHMRWLILIKTFYYNRKSYTWNIRKCVPRVISCGIALLWHCDARHTAHMWRVFLWCCGEDEIHTYAHKTCINLKKRDYNKVVSYV